MAIALSSKNFATCRIGLRRPYLTDLPGSKG